MLVIGVRIFSLPSFVIIPASLGLATGGTLWLKSQELDDEQLAKKQLASELNAILLISNDLANKAEELRQEANSLLTETDFQLELLVLVQSACDRTLEIPNKIKELGRKISQKDSLLSVEQLRQQLQEINHKKAQASGIAREQLAQLALSLQTNIQLAQTGKNTREAQLINLHTLIQNSAGVLQKLQNQLRQANLRSDNNLHELQELTFELSQYQENMNILIDD